MNAEEVDLGCLEDPGGIGQLEKSLQVYSLCAHSQLHLDAGDKGYEFASLDDSDTDMPFREVAWGGKSPEVTVSSKMNSVVCLRIYHNKNSLV